MRYLKKVAATPLTSIARVIDSVGESTNDRTNAPSIRAVREAIGHNWEDVYPVGSIYMSVNAVNPSTMFGGTWEQIKDRFLLAAGNSYTNGSTGGAATHTPTGNVDSHVLTVNEIPGHTHSVTGTASSGSNPQEIPYGDNWEATAAGGYRAYSPTGSTTSLTVSGTANSTGGGLGHTHGVNGVTVDTMPPYLTVNVWVRTA